MTSKKYFPNAIYAKRDTKLLPVAVSKAYFANNIFVVAKIFINSVPVIVSKAFLFTMTSIIYFFLWSKTYYYKVKQLLQS